MPTVARTTLLPAKPSFPAAHLKILGDGGFHLGAGALTIALTGPGRFSLDAALGLTSLWTPGVVWAAIAVGIVGGLANLGLRRSAPRSVTA